MFTVNDIGKNYKKKMVLNHISLQVAPGECIGLLGINGSGISGFSCGRKLTVLSVSSKE